MRDSIILKHFFMNNNKIETVLPPGCRLFMSRGKTVCLHRDISGFGITTASTFTAFSVTECENMGITCRNKNVHVTIKHELSKAHVHT